MNRLRGIAISVCALLLAALPASATNLVTGNGFGFAVVNPQTAMVTKFYAHPYSFSRSDPQNELSEGIATANFIKSLSWDTGGAAGASAEYEEDSHVIRIKSKAGDGLVFMPFGLTRPVLVISWKPALLTPGNSAWHVEWSHAVKSERPLPMLDDGGHRVLTFEGVPGLLLQIPLGRNRLDRKRAAGLEGSSAWALIALESAGEVDAAERELDAWSKGLTAEKLAHREVSELERWRVKPGFPFPDEKAEHLWRQSEVMLRMAQCREPNRSGFHGNGLIVASMPDGVWFTPWVRDMAWATVALAKMGHREEARAAVLAYFNAQPTGKMRAETSGADYQVSVVRYFGDGAEEPFFTEEGSTNIEYDDWGETLWVLGEYMHKYADAALLQSTGYRGQLYTSARDFIVKPLEANMEPYGGGLIVKADTSIWEERQKDKKHFAFSTAMAIVGLEEFADVAARMGDKAAQSEALQHVVRLQKGFDAAFIRDGKLHGTLEEGVKNDIDGALLAIIHFGVVKDPAIIRSTLDRMKLLKVDSGGYRRVRSTYTDPKIFEYWYERQEFLFVDFSLAEVDRQIGHTSDADAIVKRIVEKATADHDIIPEMYVALDCPLFPGAIGDPTGARPMVGYGAGEYILDVLDRASPHTMGNR
jgi:GH15 family glucan-1,4-alpha-glucosidase